jgi:multimeric flavodoxin WrbA
MYVLGISGSPREAGNTALLVQEVLKGIEGETRFISLAGLDIHPCQNCNRCFDEEQSCVIDDDLHWILQEIARCDALVLGSPCYFSNVSAQLKILIDRSVSLWGDGEGLKDKVGAAVITQDVRGSGRGGELVMQALARYFAGCRMIYAGATIGEGGREKGNVLKDQRAMGEANGLAERVIELVAKMRGS